MLGDGRGPQLAGDHEEQKMRILLVQPSERIVLGKRKAHGSIMPPLGLLTLGAVLRERFPDFTVHIADYEAKNSEPEPDFANYDIIGITGTTVHMPHAILLAKEIRQKNPGACILFGGPHATFCHQDLLKNMPELDAVVRGEGEITLCDFISQYRGLKDLPLIKGVSTRERLSKTLSPVVQDLDSLPDLAYDLVDVTKYQLSTHRRALPTPFASAITTRGCPYTCAYCQTPVMFGDRLRYRSPARGALEMRQLSVNYGIRSIVFWDDTFTANKDYTIRFCHSIGDLNLSWMCNTRVECVSRPLLRIMKESGCRIIFYGVESSQEDTLAYLRRTTNLSRVRDAFQWTHEEGIETVGTLMIGAPGDDFRRIEENIDFLKSLNPTYVYISIYNVIPGTDEFDRALREGRIRDREGDITDTIDWSDPTLFSGPPFGLPTVNENLNRFQLQQAQEYAYEQFYGPGRGAEYE